MAANVITIPENEHVYAVDVADDTGPYLTGELAVPGFVALWSENDFGHVIRLRMDGQALANALAALGYTGATGDSE